MSAKAKPVNQMHRRTLAIILGKTSSDEAALRCATAGRSDEHGQHRQPTGRFGRSNLPLSKPLDQGHDCEGNARLAEREAK